MNLKEICKWARDCEDDPDDELYNTDCGKSMYIYGQSPLEGGHKYCSFCGKPLTNIIKIKYSKQ